MVEPQSNKTFGTKPVQRERGTKEERDFGIGS